MNIQWFPGHMAKTRRMLAENLKLVDVVIELLDARIPLSSKNPEIDSILGTKPRIVAMNKADLADEAISKEWQKWYASKGIPVIFIDSIKGTNYNKLRSDMKNMMKAKVERDKLKGRIFRPIRTMVVGIPNVGKSSFINKITGRANAITGDKPGVTRGKQWIRVNEEIELLDTPGILWPKFEDARIAFNLAFTGAIKDDIMDRIELAANLMEKLKELYPERLAERFKLKDIGEKTGLTLLENAGKNRGCILSGGVIDLQRISAILLDEFRGGKMGKMTLERPADKTEKEPERKHTSTGENEQ
ncbi:MAG: ribosome biogenesis GTPase YlqF [Clostridiales bacterium]|nr:ribosome biogenesis GTPase YlqF [Clostridiales bacterium]